MDTKTAMSKKRIISFDLIRIIAALAVVMIHVSAEFVQAYPVNSSGFLLGNVFDSLSRFAIILFLMISGALFLDENKNITTKKMLTSALRMFRLLMVWSFVYAVVYRVIIPVVNGAGISPLKIFSSFLFGHYHLWYLFMIVAMYLITPVLRLFIKKENSKIILYLIGISFLVNFCTPFLNELINSFIIDGDILERFVSGFEFGLVTDFVTYYILGWYINNFEIKKKHRVIIYILGIIGLVITIIFTQILSLKNNALNSTLYACDTVNIFFYSIALFLFFHTAFKNKDLKCEKLILKLSDLTFPVYLIHIFMLSLASFISVSCSFSPFVAIIFNFAFTVITSFVLSAILKKIPIINLLFKH